MPTKLTQAFSIQHSSIIMIIGKKGVQMETQIGGDGVMKTVEEKNISAALKQP